jgi:hypothetical protein
MTPGTLMKNKTHYEFTATVNKDGNYECLYAPISFHTETLSKTESIDKENQAIKEYMNQYSDVNKLFYDFYYRNFQADNNRSPHRFNREIIDIQNMILNKLKF